MGKGSARDLVNIALIFAVALYILGGVYSWHVVSITSSDNYSSESEGFSPAGMWYKVTSNYTNYSILIPFPSEILTQNSTGVGFPVYPQTRGEFFEGMWLLYIITLLSIFGLGIISATGLKKFRFPATIIVIILIIISVAYFMVGYQTALNTDLEESGLSDLNMFGDEMVTTNYQVDSHLGNGFLFTLLSLVAFGTALVLDRSTAKQPSKKSTHSHERAPSGYAPAATASAVAAPKKMEESNFEDVVIECPQCGREFTVKVNMSKLPVTVQCPYCGAEGEIG